MYKQPNIIEINLKRITDNYMEQSYKNIKEVRVTKQTERDKLLISNTKQLYDLGRDKEEWHIFYDTIKTLYGEEYRHELARIANLMWCKTCKQNTMNDHLKIEPEYELNDDIQKHPRLVP